MSRGDAFAVAFFDRSALAERTARDYDGGVKRLLADWGIAIAVALALVVGATLLDEWRKPNGIAPPLELENIAGGTTSLTELRGQVVVVNFWGSWCGPCRSEIPEISAFAKENPDVRVLGVAVKSGEGERLKSDAKRLGITYDVLEGTSTVVDNWRVSIFPTTFIIGTDGHIRGSRMGTVDQGDLESMVEDAREAG